MEYARTIKQAVPHQRVIFTVHEMKRLGRGAAELLAIAEGLRQARHPARAADRAAPRRVRSQSGHGAALFAFFAGMAESEREYIREKSLGGPGARRASAAATAGGPKARRRRHGRLRADAAHPRRGRATRSLSRAASSPTGKNKGRHPSVASVYRIVTRFRLH